LPSCLFAFCLFAFSFRLLPFTFYLLTVPVTLPRVDPARHPAALAGVITRAWRPYRWRACAVGIVAGLLAGGVIAPIVTTSFTIALAAAGAQLQTRFPLWEVVWSLVFVGAAPGVGAAVFARWQPTTLRDAAQVYVWLALRAEANWARSFGTRPVPRDEQGTRAFLATLQPTAETASERYGLWLAVLELDRAREAIAQMPEATPLDRFTRASASWLADFVGGTTQPLEPIEELARHLNDPDERVEATVTIAVNRARVALADGRDWRVPLAEARPSLDAGADEMYQQFVSQPVFRLLLVNTIVGVVVFWAAMFVLGPYFPLRM
jgi:hypothetical protein